MVAAAHRREWLVVVQVCFETLHEDNKRINRCTLSSTHVDINLMLNNVTRVQNVPLTTANRANNYIPLHIIILWTNVTTVVTRPTGVLIGWRGSEVRMYAGGTQSCGERSWHSDVAPYTRTESRINQKLACWKHNMVFSPRESDIHLHKIDISYDIARVVLCLRLPTGS